MVNHKRYSTLCMHDNYLSAVMKLFIALGFEVQAGGAYEARKRGSERWQEFSLLKFQTRAWICSCKAVIDFY